MKYTKFLCHLGIFLTNRFVMFFGMLGWIYFLGRLACSAEFFEIYSVVLFILYPLYFFLCDILLFSEFEDHREFFKKFLKQYNKKE